MPKAKMLPSGKWRAQAFADGKRKSFTANTKKEAEYQATQWQVSQEDFTDATVERAIDRYITNRASVLSPSTIRGYRAMERSYYEDIKSRRISQLKSEDIQKFVNDLSAKYEPKTVKNAYGLLKAAIIALCPNKAINVRLPSKKPQERRIPTDEAVKTLLDRARPELKICIMLASIGTVRRGEVCALTYEDIDGNTIHVHSDMVQDENNKWVIKDIPKTAASDRYITYPPEVIQALGTGTGRIIKGTPKQIGDRYYKLVKRLHLDISTRFHDLRHYAASTMHAMGIPDQYIMEVGGWSSDKVLKSVYRNVLDDKRKEFEDMRNDYMKKLLTDETE